MSDEALERELDSLPKDEARLRSCTAAPQHSRRGFRVWVPPGLTRCVRCTQDGFVDWSEVRADDLELPEDEDFGVHTCVPASQRRLLVSRRLSCRRAGTPSPPAASPRRPRG